MDNEITIVRDESNEILSQANHCIQQKWTMRLEKIYNRGIHMGGRIKINISISGILKYNATRIVVYKYES